MKNKIEILIVLVLVLGSGARAQTNSPTSPQNFFQSVEQYFTSANTNYNWAGNTFEIAAGADYMSSVNWANYLDLQYDLGSTLSSQNSQPACLDRFALEAKIRNAGVAGTVVSAEAGLQCTLISYYSVKLQAGVDGGYDLERNAAIIEPKLTLRDKLTPNTFAGVCLSLPIWAGGQPVNNVPDIGVEAGFTY